MTTHEKALEAGLEAYNKFECGSDVDHVRSIVAGYLSALLTEDAEGLVSELCDAAYRNAGPAGHEVRLEHRAASLIQSQAARIAALEEAVGRLTSFLSSEYDDVPNVVSVALSFDNGEEVAAWPFGDFRAARSLLNGERKG